MQRYIFIVLGIVMLIGATVFVLLLRNRSAQFVEPEVGFFVGGTSTRAVATPSTRSLQTGTLTAEQQKRREEVRHLQRTLPKDIRDLWTPEFRRQQENPSR